MSFKSVAPPTLGIDVLLRIRQLGLRRHRGHRSGRSAQARTARMSPGLCPAGNGAYVMNGSRWPHRHVAVVFTEVAETESETWSTYRWCVNAMRSLLAVCKSSRP